MAVCPLRYGLLSNNFFGKKIQRNLPKKWLVTWLYGIILFIIATIFIKIMIWEKIKRSSRSLEWQIFSTFPLWISGLEIGTISFLVNVFWMWSAILSFQQRKAFYFFLKLKFHLQKRYNLVMYLEFFTV